MRGMKNEGYIESSFEWRMLLFSHHFFDFILLHGSFSFSHHLSSFVLSGANNSVRRKSIPSLNNIKTNDKTNVNETMVLTATVNNRTMEMKKVVNRKNKTKQTKFDLDFEASMIR
jgi:hypothetical protein